MKLAVSLKDFKNIQSETNNRIHYYLKGVKIVLLLYDGLIYQTEYVLGDEMDLDIELEEKIRNFFSLEFPSADIVRAEPVMEGRGGDNGEQDTEQ